jgi:hypothetical protein
MIDICGAEYDRLIEQCPPVPKKIMKRFVHSFPENNDEIKNLKFNRPEVFTVRPFDEYPFDLNTPIAKDPPRRPFFSPTIKRWDESKKGVIKELEELNKQSIVSSKSVIVNIVPSHPASHEIMEGSDEPFQECESAT